MRAILCSRKEKTGVEKVRIAFSLKRDLTKKIITVLNSKEGLR